MNNQRTISKLLSSPLSCPSRYYWAFLFLLNGLLALSASGALAATGTGGTEDYTDRLRLSPGIQIVFPIRKGIDTHWKKIGDYDFTAMIESKAPDCAFSYKWTMSPPVGSKGVRAVSLEDLHSAHKVSLFYVDNQCCQLAGFGNIVRISDALYQDLKNGVKSEFELDGPDAEMVNHKATQALPHSIQATGTESLPVIVNGEKVSVRTIEAQADNGWHYWVMDSPVFPLIVKADGPFLWENPSFTVPILRGKLPEQDAQKRGQKEGRRIVDQLKRHGEATTQSILFDFDSSKLKPQSKPILDEVAKYLKQEPSTNLSIEGHTDIIGTKDYNLKLSQRRANSVRDYLQKKASLEPIRLKTSGFGFSQPIATNKTAAGRAKNRRVVFKKF